MDRRDLRGRHGTSGDRSQGPQGGQGELGGRLRRNPQWRSLSGERPHQPLCLRQQVQPRPFEAKEVATSQAGDQEAAGKGTAEGVHPHPLKRLLRQGKGKGGAGPRPWKKTLR